MAGILELFESDSDTSEDESTSSSLSWSDDEIYIVERRQEQEPAPSDKVFVLTDKTEVIQIPKLYDLAFRGAHMHLWEQSKLPSLVVELAYRKQYVRKLNRLFTEQNEVEHLRKVQSALEIIEGSLMKLEYLPFRLKVKLLAAVTGLNEDITFVMAEIAGGLERCLKKDVKYCLSKIILTDNGGVDLSRTILNIIKQSQFKIEFTPMFLAHYCIQRSDVRAIYKVVLKEINKKLAYKNRKCKKNNKLATTRRSEKYMSSLMDCLYYWEQTRRLSRHDFDDPRFRVVSDWQYVAAVAHVDVFKFFYKKVKFSPETAHEIQEDLLQTAKFAFLSGAFNEEKIIFFYRNLQSRFWTELLRKYFKSIFLSLLSSWRYRHLCVNFFNEMVVYQHVEKLKELFMCIAELCDKQRFEYYDIISIIQSLWFETPQDFKEDIQIRQVVIPRLILLRADFETLIHFLKSYSVEIQKEILGQVVFGLLATGRKALINKYLETAKQLNLQISDCRQLIDKDSFKKFLIIDAQISRNSYSHLDTVTESLCSSKSDELKLKQELFSDSTFLVELLVNMSAKEDIDSILEWGLGNNISVNLFRKKLLQEELIHEVYDRRLLENNDLEAADKVFTLLKYDDEEISMVKERVAENPLVVRLMLTSLLETDQLKLTDKYLTWLFRTKEEQQQFMENFVLSEDGTNAIFDMLLTLENLESCPTLRFSGAHTMIKCRYIKKYWLSPFGLVGRMYEMLVKNRSQFMAHRIVVQDNDKLNVRDRMTAALYADALFRGFVLILQHEFTKFDLEDLQYLSVTGIVQSLERGSGLIIDNFLNLK